MLNFTGTTNKRVVNLGNRRGARSLTFLVQTQRERQLREQERTRERAATVLQLAVRRHLDLLRQARSVYVEWVEADASGDTFDTTQWNQWLVEFGFLATRRNIDSSDLVAKLAAELDARKQHTIDNSQRHTQSGDSIVDSRSLNAVVRGLGYVLERKDGYKTQALKVLDRVVNGDYGTVTTYPRNTVRKLYTMMRNNPSETAWDIVFGINTKDQSDAFFDVLAGDIAIAHANQKYRRILHGIDFSQMPSMEPGKLAHMLANILTVFGDPSQYSAEDFATVTPVLARMDFEVTLAGDEDDMEIDLVEEPLSMPMPIPTSNHSATVDPVTMNSIQKVYASNIVQWIISQLGHDDKQYLSALVCLLRLVPIFKDKIAMLVTLVPGFQKHLLSSIQKDSAYDYVARNPQEMVTIDFAEKDSVFWKTVYLFHESYSYWLLVSNDFESFGDDKLSREEVISYLPFLKRLCLSLILNGCPLSLAVLKETSIHLLFQLYQKSSRLKFITDHEKFWTLDSNQFNVAAMVSLIQQEEQQKKDNDDDILDKPSNKHRRGVDTFKLRGSTPHSSARLEILRKLPFFIPFMDRVSIFKRLSTIESEHDYFMPPPSLPGEIRRESVLEDAYNSFHTAGSLLKGRISVTFINEFGPEAGIDGGGLTKEFLTAVVKDGFSKSAYFKTTPEHTLYPNEDIYYQLNKRINIQQSTEQLNMIKFLGNIIGKCFYENVLVDITFAPFFLSKWGYSGKSSINDLYYYDREYFDNLIKLSKLPAREIEALDLYFTINVRVADQDFVYDLVPSGSTTKVTSTNVLNYIHQIANFKLNQSLNVQTRYFVEGLSELVEIDRLAMFSPSELQMLISGGDNPDVDIEEWKKNVSYGGYLDDDLTVQLFWDVVENDFTAKQRCKLLKFVTSVSRAPLLGFGSLQPKFGIRNSGRDTDRLPTASTCVNLLKLPDYQDRATLKAKLLYVIESDSGFDLS